MKSIFVAAAWLFLLFTTSVAFGAPPFEVKLPKGFEGPISRVQAAGEFHAFALKRENNFNATFQVIVIPIPEERKDDGLDKFLKSMMGGIEQRRMNFKNSKPVMSTLADLPSISTDWSGSAQGAKMKGRVICLVSNGKMYSVQYQDLESEWDAAIPEIEKALTTFKLAK